MKLRQAKKIGKTWPSRHRRRAMARIWKHDVRFYGMPGNMDGFMAMIWQYPTLGGKALQ